MGLGKIGVTLLYLLALTISFLYRRIYGIYFLVFTYSWIVYFTTAAHVVGKVSLIGFRNIIVIVFAVIFLLSKKKINFVKIIIPYLIFLAFSLIGIVMNEDVFFATQNFIKYLAPLAAFFIVVSVENVTEKDVKRFIIWLALADIIAGIIYFRNYFWKGYYIDAYGVKRIVTPLGEPNSSAMFMVYMVEFFLTQAAYVRGVLSKLGCFALIGISVASTAFTATRVGLVLMSLGSLMILVLILYKSKKKSALIPIIAMLTLIAVFSYRLFLPVWKRVTFQDKLYFKKKYAGLSFKEFCKNPEFIDWYTLGRYTIWKKSLEIVTENGLTFLLGKGTGNVKSVGKPMHNDYLYVLLTNGIIASICYVLFLLSALLYALKMYLRETSNRLLIALDTYLIVGFLILIIWSMVDNFLYKHDVLLYLWLPLGFEISHRRTVKKRGNQ